MLTHSEGVPSRAPTRHRRSRRRRPLAAVAAAAILIASTAGTTPDAHALPPLIPPPATARVIITSAITPVVNLVTSLVGVVVGTLPIISGVVADITPLGRTILSAVPGVVVTPDVSVHVTSTDPPTHPPSAVFPAATGATTVIANGNDGAGINVAVLDTGINAGPDFAGRLVGGVDLSGSTNPNPFVDSYGHGTFVAGLVAGSGASSGGRYTGEAPGAGLVSVKVAGATGTTDLANVIAGIQWTVANRLPLNIRVLNMSLGVEIAAPTAFNPLDQAVEAAWHAGIVVVVSAGNDGPVNGTVLSPGDDPLAITVGSIDDNATAAPADDTMSTFSSAGPTSVDGWFKPDVVTSGRSLVSVRVPNSTIDVANPSARLGSTNFVGSGTSFSSAVAAGGAALILAANPLSRPDDVKSRMLSTTRPGPVGSPYVDGHGSLDVLAAVVASAPPTLTQVPTAVIQALLGSLVPLLSGWQTSTWNPALWSSSPWTGSAWNGSNWAGSAWNGSAWNGSAWNGSAWNGSAWNGSAWNGSAWRGSAWNGSAWNGSAWNGSAWT